MYDDFGCMVTLPERYYEEMEREGIHCVPANKFKPVLSRIHNNRAHRKITVIDGKVGFTGGVNFADEYINEVVKYGHWKDTAVKIEGEAVRNFTVLFLEFWNMQVKEPMEGGPILYVDVPPWQGEGIVIPYGDGPEPLYNETIGKNVYLNMIHAAREYLYLTTPYLICDHELMGALKLAARRRVPLPSCNIKKHLDNTAYGDQGRSSGISPWRRGWTHPETALSNAERIFCLSPKEKISFTAICGPYISRIYQSVVRR